MIELHNVVVDGFKFQVLVATPVLPIRLTLKQPTTLRFSSANEISDETLYNIFPRETVRRVKRTNRGLLPNHQPSLIHQPNLIHVTYVTFVSSKYAVEFRQQQTLPKALQGSSVILDASRLHILECLDVPATTSKNKLKEILRVTDEQLSCEPLDQFDKSPLGYKSVVFTFQPGSNQAVRLAQEYPFLHVEAASHSPAFSMRYSYYHTANALKSHISQELSAQLDRRDDGDSDGGSSRSGATSTYSLSETISSVASDPRRGVARAGRGIRGDSSSVGGSSSIGSTENYEAIDPAEAIPRLEEIAQGCLVTNCDTKMAAGKLLEIITGVWPRLKKLSTPCLRHKEFELGISNAPCKHGLRCKYKHSLELCRVSSSDDKVGSGGGCKGPKKCSRIHESEVDTILRLDVDLCTICEGKSVGGFTNVLQRLEVHGRNMAEEANKLLTMRRDLKTSMEADFKRDEAQPAASIEAAQRREAALDAKRSRIIELEHQIDEFTKSLQGFLVADPRSFRAARMFAREV